MLLKKNVTPYLHSCYSYLEYIYLHIFNNHLNQQLMKRLFVLLVLCICTQWPLYAYVTLRTCTCYTGWACNGNDDGSSSCTAQGASWTQASNKPCSPVHFVSGSYGVYQTTAVAGGSYGTPYMIDSGTLNSAMDIPPGCN